MCINEGVQENDEMMKVIISTSLQRHQKLNRKLLATALDTKILGSTRTYVNFLHTSEPGKKVDESECSVLFRCEAYQGLDKVMVDKGLYLLQKMPSYIQVLFFKSHSKLPVTF